jgi:hypothetical protein
VPRNFRPTFFSSINPKEGPDSRPKAVIPKALIRRENQQYSNFSGVNDHAEIFLAGSLTLQKPGFRKPLH